MNFPLSFRNASASSLALAASLLTASALLTGCSSKFDPMAGTTPPQTAIGSLKGSVYGGRTAITGASVYLYETGTTGYGSASTSLLTSYPNGSSAGGGPTTPDSNGNYYVTTDGNGYFNISGDYTCTAGGQVYTYAVGGNASAGTGINSAIGLIAALGVCPASGTLAGTLPYINMNEASTIAAAYALAGFSVDALHIGIPTSPNATQAALEQTNLSNAFLTSANIFPMSSPLPTGSFATTTAASGTVNAITAYSISSGVATFTCNNALSAGNVVALSGFPTSTFLNGQSVTVLSATSSSFTANVSKSTATITAYKVSSNVVTFTSANSFYLGEALTLSGFGSTNPTGGTAFNGQTVTVSTTGTTSFKAAYTATNTSSTVSGLTALATETTATITESGLATFGAIGNLPTTKLNALANSLAACINSTGPTSAPCVAVLQGSTTDTASAAIYIAQHPAANVSTIFGAAAGTALPYNNALSTSPNDWTISIIYSGGGLSVDGTSCCSLAPHNVGIDASGNVWTTSTSTPWTLSGFSNLGVPLSSAGFTNANLAYPSGAVLDAASQNVFIVDEINPADTAYGTTINEYNIAGNSWTTITPVSGSTAELDDPLDLTFDGAGDLWVVNTQTDYLTKITPSASAPYTYTYSINAKNTSYVTTPYAVAAEPGATGTIWTVGSGQYADIFTDADVYSTKSSTDYSTSYAVAIDGSGNAWVPGVETGISKIPAAGGTPANFAYPSNYYLVEVLSLAIDGAGNVWLPDIDNGLLLEYNNSGTIISTPYGYFPNEGTVASWVPPAKPTTGYVVPAYIAIDGSGNVWTKPQGTTTLQEMVGVAVPTVTSTAYATANSLLGQEP